MRSLIRSGSKVEYWRWMLVWPVAELYGCHLDTISHSFLSPKLRCLPLVHRRADGIRANTTVSSRRRQQCRSRNESRGECHVFKRFNLNHVPATQRKPGTRRQKRGRKVGIQLKTQYRRLRLRPHILALLPYPPFRPPLVTPPDIIATPLSPFTTRENLRCSVHMLAHSVTRRFAPGPRRIWGSVRPFRARQKIYFGFENRGLDGQWRALMSAERLSVRRLRLPLCGLVNEARRDLYSRRA